MGALSPVHLIIVLVIALLVIGPGKLPETGAALGRAIRRLPPGGRRDAAGRDPGAGRPGQPCPAAGVGSFLGRHDDGRIGDEGSVLTGSAGRIAPLDRSGAAVSSRPAPVYEGRAAARNGPGLGPRPDGAAGVARGVVSGRPRARFGPSRRVAVACTGR